MQFIIVYDRPNMKLLTLREFGDGSDDQARAEKLSFELEYANRGDTEVALFQSDSQETLRKTHGRYFKTIGELAEDVGIALKAS